MGESKSNRPGGWNVSLIVVMIATTVFASWKFEEYQFDPITVSSILDVLVPLFVVAVFLERAQEVFISAWRDSGRWELERLLDKFPQVPSNQDASQESDLDDLKRQMVSYKATTAKSSLYLGLTVGVLIAVVGVRCLKPLTSMDADPIGIQQYVFNLIDIGLTGALIGGGSEGIHKVMGVITDFLNTSRENIKAKSAAKSNSNA